MSDLDDHRQIFKNSTRVYSIRVTIKRKQKAILKSVQFEGIIANIEKKIIKILLIYKNIL